MRRRQTWAGIACLLVVAALLVRWVSASGDDEAQDEVTSSESSGYAADAALRGNAPTPPVNDQPAESKPDKPTPAKLTRETPLAYVFGLAHEEDDPALPAERRKVDLLAVDLDGRPVPRLIVRGAWGEWHTRAYETDAEGRVVLHLPRNTRAIEAVGQSGASTGTYGFIHVHPIEPDSTSTRMVIRSYRVISGRVLVGGKPTPSGTVRAYRLPRPKTRDGQRLVKFYNQAHVTAKRPVWGDGRFELNVPDDAPVTLLYTADDARPATTAILHDVAPGTKDIDLIAFLRTERRAISLRVLDAAGHPVVGAPISLHPIGQKADLRATTDNDGRASVDAQADWLYRLDISPPFGGLGMWGPYRELFTADGVEREIVLPAKPVKIHGTVVDADGRPVQRAWLAIMDGPDLVAAMGTDANGRFEGPSNAARGTVLHVYARFPMERPTSRGYAERVLAGDPIHIELEEIGPLTVKDAKKKPANAKDKVKPVRIIFPPPR